MYSEQVKRTVKKASERRHYSELQVLKSPAGYYVGTYYTNPTYDFIEPGSRDSVYFATEQEAKALLVWLETGAVDYTDPRMRITP